MDNIKTWTGLSVEESIRMTEDRDKWRKYVSGVHGQPSDRGRLKNGIEQNVTYVLWYVDVEDVHCVEINGVKTTTRAVEHLQSLTFLDGQIDHDGPVRQLAQRLTNIRQDTDTGTDN